MAGVPFSFIITFLAKQLGVSRLFRRFHRLGDYRFGRFGRSLGIYESINVAPLRSALGNTLPGAQGKSVADQNRIDRTVVPGRAVKLYTRSECDKHTKASAARRAELQ